MAIDNIPRRGLRFLHSKWLNAEDHSPMMFEVTMVRRGLVYYRAIYKDGTTGRASYVETVPDFPNRVKQYL